MKINAIPAICGLLLAAILAYTFSVFGFPLLTTIVAGVTMAVTLVCVLGIDFKSKGCNANIKVIMGTGTVVFCVTNIVFGLLKCGTVPVVIVNGTLAVIILLITERIYHAKM